MRGTNKNNKEATVTSANSLSSFGEKERKEAELLAENLRKDLKSINAWTRQARCVSPPQVGKGAMSSGTEKQTIGLIMEYVKQQREFAKWLEAVCDQLGGVKTEE